MTSTSDPPKRRRFVTFQGRTQSIADWARELGLDLDTLYKRIGRGWTVAQALTRPSRRIQLHEVDGTHATIGAHARQRGLGPDTVAYRLKRGMSLAAALAKPGRKQAA